MSLGIGRTGGMGQNSSGDIFVAFSTANPRVSGEKGVQQLQMLPNPAINPLFYATVQATEEAILNALLAAETMTGANDVRLFALPEARLVEIMRWFKRLP